jgi:SHS2 domain-containing protein
MAYRFLDHTAELVLELEAETREGVLAEAAVALGELLDPDTAGPVATRRVEATAPDDAALLAAWLEELVFLAETEDFVPRAVRGAAVRDGSLQQSVAWRVAAGIAVGVIGAPRHLVKAVTYNELELRREGDRWVGRAVLDV